MLADGRGGGGWSQSYEGSMSMVFFEPFFHVLRVLTGKIYSTDHKVLTYNRVQSSVWRLPNYWPPTPLYTQQVWGVHTRRAVRGWGSIVWKTPDIWLASYSIIPLRHRPIGTRVWKLKTRVVCLPDCLSEDQLARTRVPQLAVDPSPSPCTPSASWSWEPQALPAPAPGSPKG